MVPYLFPIVAHHDHPLGCNPASLKHSYPLTEQSKIVVVAMWMVDTDTCAMHTHQLSSRSDSAQLAIDKVYSTTLCVIS